MSSRRRALAAGLAAAILYVGVAAIAGHLYPLARRPILDGLAPQQPYRWVKPPPDRKSDNVPPSIGTFDVQLGSDGAKPNVYSTADLQVTLIVAKGLFPAAHGQDTVLLRFEPLDPAKFPRAPTGLRISGNVYRITAAYQPGGDPITSLPFPAELVLVYPQIPAPPGVSHFKRTLLFSEDGKRWMQIKTSDLPALLQAEGGIPSLGYVTVAAEGVKATSGPGSAAGSQSTGLIVAIVVGACVLLPVIGLIARSRGRGRPNAGARSTTRAAAGSGRPPGSAPRRGGSRSSRHRKRR